MDSKTNKILAKLSKEKGLKKVQLSKLDNVEEFISIGYSAVEFFDEMFDEGIMKVRDSRDVLKFDATDNAQSAEEELDELIQEIKELGVETPPKVKQLQKEIEDLYQAIKKGEMKLRDAGM